MDLKGQRCSIQLVIGILTACLAGGAGAQESLDRGRNSAQLFASDCSVCHKSPQGLARAGGLLGVDSFLREHYTTSRESAAAMAAYLRSMDSGPAGPGRAAKRTAKGDEKAKSDEKKKPAAKPGEAKGIEKKPDAAAAEPKSTDPKPSDSRPADIVAPEKSAAPKPSAPAAGEAKPAEGAKSEKSD